MIALAQQAEPQDSAGGRAAGWEHARFSTLFSATADRHPGQVAFADQPNRETWSGRPRIAWTYANTQRIVDRLATALARLNLPAGAPVGLCLPNGSEASVSLLAVERAGYVPCLLPIGWSEDRLGQALEAANVVAVVCQSRIAEEQPAEMFCRLAARYFGIRFVCAFGPHVPDGVIDLDRAILDTDAALPLQANAPIPGIVTFEVRNERIHPLFRPSSSCLAAGAACLAVQRIDATDRILSLVAPDDLRGLTTGLVASLLTGATLESHGLVDSASLEAALRTETPTHLVAPGWMEPILARADLPGIVSIVLVHDAPVRFKARGELRRPVTDVLGFGELALVSRARSDTGHLMLTFEDYEAAPDRADELLRIRRDDSGMVHFGGLAADVYEFGQGSAIFPVQEPQWRSSGFKADLFAGIVIGVR